jgi:DNA-binding NarL/FixJ family response regulator
MYFLYNFSKRKNHFQKEAPMTIRILLVDDHTVVRKGLRTFLPYDPDLEVVGEAADGAQALTERETEVLRLLALGYSNKQIAHSLNNTEKTIKTHVSRILSKLGVQSRTQATLYAIRTGLVSPNAPGTEG